MILIVYHSADFDGILSGHIAYSVLMNENLDLPPTQQETIELYPYNYGDQIDQELVDRATEIYFCDIMFNFGKGDEFTYQYIQELKKTKSIIWNDHHVVAVKCPLQIWGYQREDVSAAYLTWQYFSGMGVEKNNPWKTAVPKVVQLVSDHDIWNHSDMNSWYLQYGLHNHEESRDPLSPIWEQLFSADYLNQIIEEGRALYEFQLKQDIKYAAENSVSGVVEGYRALICNGGSSMGMEPLFDSTKYDIYIFYHKNAKGWKIDWRSHGIDVSALARKHGGGGHVRAAGCIVQSDSAVLKELFSAVDNP